MTPRSELRQKVRRDLRQRALEARRRLASHPAVRRRRRRRWVLFVIVVLVLLALLAARCSCDEGPLVPLPTPESVEGTQSAPSPWQAPRAPTPRMPPAQKNARERFDAPEPATPAWLSQFRRQVAARSPRLRECFRAAANPGALRWSALLHFGEGTVSDHGFEPLGEAQIPDDAERRCLEEVLSAPPYHFENAPHGVGPMARIGLVLEF